MLSHALRIRTPTELTESQLAGQQKITRKLFLQLQGRKLLFIVLPLVSKQWGSFEKVVSGSVISLPISATPVVAIPVDINISNNSLIYSTIDYRNGSFRVYGNRLDGNTDIYGNWLAICF